MTPIELCARHRVPVTGVIHVGANRAQGHLEYAKSTAGPILYVEPIPEMCKAIRAKLDPKLPHFLYEGVCSDVAGKTVKFNVSNNWASSSLLPIGTISDVYKNIHYVSELVLETSTVDSIVVKNELARVANVLVLDVQGSELSVLKGAVGVMDTIEAVHVEVSEEPMYEGSCTFNEIYGFLTEKGFHLRYLYVNSKVWGEAFFVKPNERLAAFKKNLATGKLATQSSVDKVHGADLAVNGKFPQNKGSTTAAENAPWWQVDLGEISSFKRIVLDLGLGKAFARYKTLTVSISDDGKNYRTVFDARKTGRPQGRLVDIHQHGQARYVRCALAEKNILHLAQVGVIA